MDNPETLKDARLVIDRLRQELSQANKLVEFYRQFQTGIVSKSSTPPCYFVHLMSDGKWGAGRVFDGRLDVLSQGHATEQDAVDTCWAHYQEEGLPM